jgi:hypothetical protein
MNNNMKCPECGNEMQRRLVDLTKDVIEVGMVLPLWAYVYTCCDWEKTEVCKEAENEARIKREKLWVKA